MHRSLLDMPSGRAQVHSWPDAEAFAVRVVPGLPGGVEEGHYHALARQLVAAAAWHLASTGGSPEVDLDEVARVVRPELPADRSDLAERLLSTCPDRRVSEAVAQVRARGRAWVAVTEPEYNLAAWIALNCLARAGDVR